MGTRDLKDLSIEERIAMAVIGFAGANNLSYSIACPPPHSESEKKGYSRGNHLGIQMRNWSIFIAGSIEINESGQLVPPLILAKEPVRTGILEEFYKTLEQLNIPYEKPRD